MVRDLKKFNFLICYDISCPKRLQKIAKELEKESIRIQKSIFYYKDATNNDIKNITKVLDNIMDNSQDDIRIYQIDIINSLNINSAVDLKQPNLLVGELYEHI